MVVQGQEGENAAAAGANTHKVEVGKPTALETPPQNKIEQAGAGFLTNASAVRTAMTSMLHRAEDTVTAVLSHMSVIGTAEAAEAPAKPGGIADIMKGAAAKPPEDLKAGDLSHLGNRDADGKIVSVTQGQFADGVQHYFESYQQVRAGVDGLKMSEPQTDQFYKLVKSLQEAKDEPSRKAILDQANTQGQHPTGDAALSSDMVSKADALARVGKMEYNASLPVVDAHGEPVQATDYKGRPLFKDTASKKTVIKNDDGTYTDIDTNQVVKDITPEKIQMTAGQLAVDKLMELDPANSLYLQKALIPRQGIPGESFSPETRIGTPERRLGFGADTEFTVNGRTVSIPKDSTLSVGAVYDQATGKITSLNKDTPIYFKPPGPNSTPQLLMGAGETAAYSGASRGESPPALTAQATKDNPNEPAGVSPKQGEFVIVGAGDPKDPMSSLDVFNQNDTTMRAKHEILGTTADGVRSLETKQGRMTDYYDMPRGMYVAVEVNGQLQTGPGALEGDGTGILHSGDHSYPVLESNSAYTSVPIKLDGTFDPEGAWRVVTGNNTKWDNPAGNALKDYLKNYDFSSIPAGPKGQATYDFLAKAVQSGIKAGTIDANIKTQLEQARSASEIALARATAAPGVDEPLAEGPEKGTLADRLGQNPEAREALKVLNPAELKEAERIATLPPEERARAVGELAREVQRRGGLASSVVMFTNGLTQLLLYL